jgi:hypothetical protein
VKTALLVAATLLLQYLLGLPGMPHWSVDLMVPMVWVVGPSLLRHERQWPYLALTVGLAWDLLLEPIVGPGGIAWSASALVCWGLAVVVADRSPRAWFAFGAVGAAVVILVRQLALLPLGQAAPLLWVSLFRSILLTGIWCGMVSWIIVLDLPQRWRRYRARRLR